MQISIRTYCNNHIILCVPEQLRPMNLVPIQLQEKLSGGEDNKHSPPLSQVDMLV